MNIRLMHKTSPILPSPVPLVLFVKLSSEGGLFSNLVGLSLLFESVDIYYEMEDGRRTRMYWKS